MIDILASRYDSIWFDKINCPVQPLSIIFPPKLQTCCQAAFNAFIAAGLCTKATLQVDDAPSSAFLCTFLHVFGPLQSLAPGFISSGEWLDSSTIFDMQTSCWRYLWTFGQAEEVLSSCCRSWSKASKNIRCAKCKGLFVETSIQICSVTSFRDDV